MTKPMTTPSTVSRTGGTSILKLVFIDTETTTAAKAVCNKTAGHNLQITVPRPKVQEMNARVGTIDTKRSLV
jgi:hypothetical protein